MYANEVNGLLKEGVKKAFLSLGSMRDGLEETRRAPWAECYDHECRLALKNFTRIKEGRSDT